MPADNYVANYLLVAQRHGFTDVPLLSYLSRQPGWVHGDAPVAAGYVAYSTLAGPHFEHPLSYIADDEPCDQIRAAARRGWVILQPISGEPYAELDYLRAPACMQGIKPVARLKLEWMGLDGYFDFEAGAYGNDHHMRVNLVPIAVARAEQRYGRAFAGHEVGLLAQVLAATQEDAHDVAALLEGRMIGFAYSGAKTRTAHVAFPMTPVANDAGPVYRFSVLHLVELNTEGDLSSLFPIEYEEI